MKKLRLLCIPPYEGMYHLMLNIAARRSDVELIIHMGNLDDGLKAVEANRENHIDAIISRGGTAETIRRHTDIPAYDIVPSVYDMLRTIRLAQGMAERFAIVGYPSLTTPASMLRDILQFDFHVHTIESPEECLAAVESLKEQGIRVIVGDMISVTQAQQCGMSGLLIVSGLESIETAIDQAIRTHSHYEKISHSAQLLADILKTSRGDTVVYSSRGDVIFSTFETIPERLGSFFRQKYSTVIAVGTLKNLCRMDSSLYAVSGRRLNCSGEDYCVYEVLRHSASTLFDRYRIRYLSRDEDLPDSHPLEFYLGISEKVRDLQATCARYAAMSAPVLLIGPRGSGKDRFAHYIYTQSSMRQNSFLMIDCALLDEKGWNFLLHSDTSPLTDSGLSLYFMRVNAAAPEQRSNLLYYLKSSHAASLNRLYFSYSTAAGYDPKDPLLLYLTETLHCLQLTLPALSARLEDIPPLMSLYINTINVQHGTRVIGFTPDAAILMQAHTWSHNIDQLFQAVRNLVLHARTSYISADQVKALFEKEGLQESASVSGLNLKRPLSEITRDIVMQVYREENMNQTHTAKRLGISRSTLWRLLKE